MLLALLLVVLVSGLGLVARFSGSPPTTPAGSGRSTSAPSAAGETTTTEAGPAPADTSWAPSAGGTEPAIYPTAVVDPALDNLFHNKLGPGWVGGDATYSTVLRDGREAFVFSDTAIGTTRPSGNASLTGVPHNSELVGHMPSLVSDYGGTYEKPSSLIPDSLDAGDTWQTAATFSEGGNQLIFVNEFAPNASSMFDTYIGHSGIAVMTEPPAAGLPKLRSVTLLPTDPGTEWGNASVQGNRYTYVYGSATNLTTGAFIGMKVARVPGGTALDTDTWKYWNGSGWVAAESEAVPVTTGNELTGVVQEPGAWGYVAVSIPTGVFSDKTVDLSYARAPTGPWTPPLPVYAVPQVAQYPDEISYVPTFHPELSAGNVLVVSYNIDSCGGVCGLNQDVHTYQPQFLQVSG